MSSSDNDKGYDDKIREYLEKLPKSTHDVATAAIDAFTDFYKGYSQKKYGAQLGVIDYFKKEYDDSKRHPLDRERVSTNTIAAFNTYLESQFAQKTVRTYTGAMQSLGQYLGIPFSTRFTGLPPPLPLTKKHCWELNEVAPFIESFDDPMYQAYGTAFFQSGSDISTLNDILYKDIKKEVEAGIYPISIDMARHKTHIPHYTFLGEWATKYLLIYLNERGTPDPEERVFPVSKQSVDDYFLKKALKFANVEKFDHRNPYSPHTLRASFNTQARTHKADPIFIPFIMGHGVPEQEKVYALKTPDGWRETYVLQFEPWVTPPQYRRKELRDIAKAWAKSQGVDLD